MNRFHSSKQGGTTEKGLVAPIPFHWPYQGCGFITGSSSETLASMIPPLPLSAGPTPSLPQVEELGCNPQH